jgi:hypothetical protein
MSTPITIADLVLALQSKDQTMPVEYLVVSPAGQLVAMNIQHQAKPMVKVLKMVGD